MTRLITKKALPTLLALAMLVGMLVAFPATARGGGSCFSMQPTNADIKMGENASFTFTTSDEIVSVVWEISTNGGISFSNISSGAASVIDMSTIGKTSLKLTKVPLSYSGYQFRAKLTVKFGGAFASSNFTEYSDIVILTVTQDIIASTPSTIADFIHGGSGSLAVSTSGMVVTVTGTVTGVKNSMPLRIPGGYTVVWKADYSGSIQTGSSDSRLISLTGAGVFEVASGGVIRNTGTGNCIYESSVTTAHVTIKVTGGTVASQGTASGQAVDGAAIVSNMLNINGGVVSSVDSIAVIQRGGSATVSGGTIRSEKDSAYSFTNGSSLTISGGTICSMGKGAIRNSRSDNLISISGGVLFGIGTTLTGTDSATAVISEPGGSTPTVTGSAIICGWSKGSGAATYAIGSSTALLANTGTTVKWDIVGGQSGISYANGSNKSFLPVAGAPVTGTPPTLTYPTSLNLTLAEGYAATSTAGTPGEFQFDGAPRPVVTKVSGDAKITLHQNSDRVLSIAEGLTAGTYPVVLKASNGASPDATFTFTVTVIKGVDPVITKQPSDIVVTPLTERYPYGDQMAFTVSFSVEATGEPLSYQWQMYNEQGSKWEDISGTTTFWSGGRRATLSYAIIDDPEWWLYKDAPHRCAVTNGVTTVYSDSVKWTFGNPSAPTIAGPATMTLEAGYESIATEAFTITGTPAPEVTIDSDDAKITWDGDALALRIAEGLEAGEYAVTIKASNGIDPEAEHTFTLTVEEEGEEGGGESPMDNFIKVNSYVRGQFPDVDETAWYGYDQQKTVALAYEYGLMKGNADGTFNPGGNVTVGQALAVACRVHVIYSGSDALVEGDPWYRVYVDYAIEHGIITARDFSDFNRPATRAEMVYIFANALPENEFPAINTVNTLPDVDNSIQHSAQIFMMYEAGILTGNDDAGTFTPGANISRAQAAAIISRVILPATRAKGKTYPPSAQDDQSAPAFAKYDSADNFSEGFARVKIGELLGFIDKTGKVVVPIKYDGAKAFRDGMAWVSLDGKGGFIDKTGTIVVPLKYDGSRDFCEGLARVTLDGKRGFVDKSGKEITATFYDNADIFYEGMARVLIGDKWGYIDNTGKEIS